VYLLTRLKVLVSYRDKYNIYFLLYRIQNILGILTHLAKVNLLFYDVFKDFNSHKFDLNTTDSIKGEVTISSMSAMDAYLSVTY